MSPAAAVSALLRTWFLQKTWFLVIRSFRRHRPVLQPHPERIGLRARDAPGAPAQLLERLVAIPSHVGQGEVRHVDLVGRPVGGAGRALVGRGERAAEEGKLVAELLAGLARQVARVVPPLGLEIVVRALVEREGQRAARFCTREAGRVGGRGLGDQAGAHRALGAGPERPRRRGYDHQHSHNQNSPQRSSYPPICVICVLF